MQMSRSLGSRRGGAAVEFAIIVPILAALMLGMIEVTRAVQVKNVLTDTARSSCRTGIQPGTTTQTIKDNVNTILTANGINPSLATISVLVNNQNVEAAAAKKYDTLSVKIALPIASVNWVTPLFFSNLAVESETLVMMHQ